MKRVVLGVSGGIAAYKACEVLRGLQSGGCTVHVVMTQTARRFVGEATFEALSGRPVIADLFDPRAGSDFAHIRLARWADLFLVAPCTADVLGKLAHGIADDFLTTFFTATKAPTLLAPSMNVAMWNHPPVRDNLAQLRSWGVHVCDPEEGALACGEEGPGRLASVEDIVDRALEILAAPAMGPLSGRSVLMTAGPTREDLDPVRCLTSRSSGRMGSALAETLRERGARVVLVHGPLQIPVPEGIESVAVTSAREMERAVQERVGEAEIFIAAAAVSDFRPAEASPVKLKKESGEEERTVRLVRNPDILGGVASAEGRDDRLLIGFAVESEDLEANARAKLESRGLDLVVANPVSSFDVEETRGFLVTADGARPFGPCAKGALAEVLADWIEERLAGRESS